MGFLYHTCILPPFCAPGELLGRADRCSGPIQQHIRSVSAQGRFHTSSGRAHTITHTHTHTQSHKSAGPTLLVVYCSNASERVCACVRNNSNKNTTRRSLTSCSPASFHCTTRSYG
jgi:hypothetical protein